ncbi:FAD-binding protein [Pseudomonas hefeiensis]|uniref:FAD-binding protein n=1 Tax=Pseudomonas hefeiensis TaxID=2738125 RepID=UPI00273545BF|nr:FAD-binding protein [Pseudomonas sp. FP53]WLH97866.1 FAD-binding protein [Pseudomonas sp. FP53]
MKLSLQQFAKNLSDISLEGYRGALSDGVNPIGVAHPCNADDIIALIKWARKTKTQLSIFSSGPGNRSHGSMANVPTVFIDLSKMNRIAAVSERDRVAVIEAGVTFEALDEALLPYGLRSYKPLQPRANKSVLASYLDREPFLQSRDQWDVLDPIGAGEIVFGTGDAFRTGSASHKKSADDLWKAGTRFLTAIGPAAVDFMRIVQGAQGWLGIVPWAAVLCEPIPKLSASFFVPAESPGALAELSASLHRRRLGNATFLANRLQLATLLESNSLDAYALAATLPPLDTICRN